MKCTNRRIKRSICLCMIVFIFFLTGCSGTKYSFAYDPDYGVSSFGLFSPENARTAEPFAAQLCVVPGNTNLTNGAEIPDLGAALLCDVNDAEVLYAQGVHERLHPASLTKVMTALVAIKYGSMNQVLTASENVVIKESGAQLCGLKPGDTMTLAQALHVLLIYSANDAAVLIAEGVSGDNETFVNLMNEEAIKLGATNTHFTNPHGLTAEDHYTTAYDLYLIFNEAIKYEAFREIIHMDSYETVYYDKSGNEKNLSVNTTNLFLRGNYSAPENVTIVGGKTGTTNAARSCLVLLSRDISGDPYISVILKSETRDLLYAQMRDLLSQIGN